MPYAECEEGMNAGLPSPRSEKVTMVDKSGADDDDSEAEVTNAQLAKCLAHPKERTGGPRKWHGRADYVNIKSWVTGESAELEEEDIEREMFELAREFMHASKLRKTPGHKSLATDFALWKCQAKARNYSQHLPLSVIAQLQLQGRHPNHTRPLDYSIGSCWHP